MIESLWKSTLADFSNRLRTREPVPAGVSVAAIAAALGLSLLTKVLEIARHRKDFEGDPKRVEDMIALARELSDRLQSIADEDIAAYTEYMAARKSPDEARALRRAIDVPLGAARAVGSGLVLCDQAARFTPPAIAPDLGTARNLLTGALQSILLSVDSNAKHLSDAGLRSDIEREREHLIELAKNHQSW